MNATSISVPGDGTANEDRAVKGDSWAFVLDGAGPYAGFDYGCEHSASWLVDQLACHLADALDNGDGVQLAKVLARAIQETREAHGPTCDVDHPLALGATVGIIRSRRGLLEWLVLGDSTAVFECTDGQTIYVHDDRLDRLDGPVTDADVRTFHPDYVATKKNRPGGFWVAGAVPGAASHAYSGQVGEQQVPYAMLCTDGVSRLVERYGWTWSGLLDTARREGPLALVSAVREAERTDPDPCRWRGKHHDDATVVYLDLSAGETTVSESVPTPVPDEA